MLKVKVTRDDDERKMSVQDMEDGQLFEHDSGEIGIKVDHGWIILDEDDMVPFIWDELDKDGNESFNECLLLDGTVKVEVKLQ